VIGSLDEAAHGGEGLPREIVPGARDQVVDSGQRLGISVLD